ncbi:MAG TPA: sugar phosphate isomerase/epimerase family protein [Armatimonadota bacterium]|jgi:sugar phosphate isomerase/epimerase
MMTPALFSVSYAGLWGQQALDLPAFLRKAADLGYPAVELMGKRPHLSPLDFDAAGLTRLKDTAAACGVEIATVAAYTDFTAGVAHAEIPEVEIQVAYVRELCRMAAQLGAKIVRVFTGYATDELAIAADWGKCVTALRECARLAEGEGVVLGVQNHHDVGVSTEAFQALLDAVDHPNCQAMFDPWAAALHGDDLYACAKQLAPRMVQSTFADYRRLRRFKYLPGLVNYQPLPEQVQAVPLGEGFIDYPAFMRGLIDGGFSGYLAYEMCSPLQGGGSEDSLDATARTSLARMREWIGTTP